MSQNQQYIFNETITDTSFDTFKLDKTIEYGSDNKVSLVKIVNPTQDQLHIAHATLSSNIKLTYPCMLDGGGLYLKDALVDVIKKTTKEASYPYAFEWCAGFGVLGYEILGQGLAGHITFSDYLPLAIETCLQNAKDNYLEKYVSGLISPTIADLPLHEPFNLVVSNPPHVSSLDTFYNWAKESDGQLNPESFYQVARLCVDQDWSIHREFFANIRNHCSPTADIYLIENSNDKVLQHMAKLYGLYTEGVHKVQTPHKAMHDVFIFHYKFNH